MGYLEIVKIIPKNSIFSDICFSFINLRNFSSSTESRQIFWNGLSNIVGYLETVQVILISAIFLGMCFSIINLCIYNIFIIVDWLKTKKFQMSIQILWDALKSLKWFRKTQYLQICVSVLLIYACMFFIVHWLKAKNFEMNFQMLYDILKSLK